MNLTAERLLPAGAPILWCLALPALAALTACGDPALDPPDVAAAPDAGPDAEPEAEPPADDPGPLPGHVPHFDPRLHSDTADDPPGVVMLPCHDQVFTVSCQKLSHGHQVCVDYFGGWTEAIVRPQCEGADGTVFSSPCDLPDRLGTCRHDELAGFCYLEHVRGDAAVEVFWEGACPASGGTWIPA